MNWAAVGSAFIGVALGVIWGWPALLWVLLAVVLSLLNNNAAAEGGGG